MLHCPNQFIRVAQLLENNSLFGMQFLTDTNRFVPCYCRLAQTLYRQMIETIDCRTLEASNIMGHECFTIAWYEYDKIPALYNSLINANITFMIKMNHIFHGYCANDPPFVYTPENMEKTFVTGMTRMLGDSMTKHIAMHELRHNMVIFDPWNYITPEGYVFCQHVCQLCSKPFKSLDDPNNYKLWGWYQSLTKIIEESFIHDDMFTCVIKEIPLCKHSRVYE